MTLTAEEDAIVATVRDFVNKEVKPVVQELEHANTYPAELIDTMKEIGVFGLSIPEPYGFGAVSMPCYVRVAEELARGWMSLAGAMGGHTVVAKLLVTFGTEEQKQRYLPLMATGELRATMALTEPGGGSDLQGMRTVARRDGDAWVVPLHAWVYEPEDGAPIRGATLEALRLTPHDPQELDALYCELEFNSLLGGGGAARSGDAPDIEVEVPADLAAADAHGPGVPLREHVRRDERRAERAGEASITCATGSMVTPTTRQCSGS